MEDALIALLESFGHPVYRQGSVSEYPPSFFTFRNNDSEDHAHYDNIVDYGTNWDFSIYFYSIDPSLTYSVLSDAITLLKQNEWIVTSKGFDVRSDEQTHMGRGFTAYYLEV